MPENAPELSPEEVGLWALEAKLAHVRQILFHAGRTRTAHKPQVRALGELAEELHHEVLQQLARAESARCSTCGPRSVG